MFLLKDKIVLVTGGSAGIGATLVREILKGGAKHVRILDVDEKSGVLLQNELKEKYGVNKVKFVKCDVTDDEQFFEALEDTKEQFSYIDLLINNAGVGDESSLKSIRKLIEINYIAVVNGTLKAIELMRQDKKGRGGTVINIASIAALFQVSPMFTYSSTKRAVVQFSTCVGRVPCEDTGVRVMSICLGVTDTEIIGKLKCFEERLDLETQKILSVHPVQSPLSAASGILEAYRKGESGSTWLVRGDAPALDITANLSTADEDMERIIMSLI